MQQHQKRFQEFERDASNAVAQAYARWADGKTSQVLPALLAAARISAGDRVLDVATGPGFAAGAASRLGADVVGIDLSEQMIGCARSAYPGIDFRVGAAECLPLDRGAIDVVLSSFGLPHFADHRGAFAEFRRVLRRGGRLAMSTWAPPARNPFMELVFGGVIVHGDPSAGGLPAGESPFAYGDPERCRVDLEAAGFQRVVVTEVELTFPIDGAAGVIRFLTEVGTRSRASYESQTDTARVAIDRYVSQHIGAFLDPDGVHRVPAVAVIVSAAG